MGRNVDLIWLMAASTVRSGTGSSLARSRTWLRRCSRSPKMPTGIADQAIQKRTVISQQPAPVTALTDDSFHGVEIRRDGGSIPILLEQLECRKNDQTSRFVECVHVRVTDLEIRRDGVDHVQTG